MEDCKVLKFRNKKLEFEEKMKKQNIKEIAKFLIDSCEGDFAIVFKTKDIEHIFDGIKDTRFIVAMSDVEKRKTDNPDYFFTGFANSDNRQYFDLKND